MKSNLKIFILLLVVSSHISAQKSDIKTTPPHIFPSDKNIAVFSKEKVFKKNLSQRAWSNETDFQNGDLIISDLKKGIYHYSPFTETLTFLAKP